MNRTTLLLVVAICAGTLISCSRSAVSANGAAGPAGMPPVAVRAVAASVSDVPLEISAIGNVEAITMVDVKARVTAPILRVAFADGQDLKQGQLLFELDPEVFNRQISEIEANVARDVANEKQSEANITKDKATLDNAQTLAERGTQLQKEGIFSREQKELVVSNAAAAKASIEADAAALDSARAAEKADSARLAQTKLQLSYTKVYAPISGRAGAIQIKQGSLAKENDTTLVTILQVAPIYVTFAVPENTLPQVRQYNDAHPLAVEAVSADNTKNTGVLRFIDNSVDNTTGTIKLKATFGNERRNLWPGQFVNVRAQLNVEKGRVLVPARTVQTGPQGKYVWIINPDSTAAMRNVQVLRNFAPPGHGEEAVIGSGIREGEMVISEGQLRLAPGAHVKLLKSNSGTDSGSAS